MIILNWNKYLVWLNNQFALHITMLRRFVSKKSITPNDSIPVTKNDDNVFSDFINEYIELLKKTEPEFYEYIIKI